MRSAGPIARRRTCRRSARRRLEAPGAEPSSITSVSEPRKRWPSASSSVRKSGIVHLAVVGDDVAAVGRVHRLSRGGERSTIESRRWPSAIPASASARPPRIGPAMASALGHRRGQRGERIRARSARGRPRSRRCRTSQPPAAVIAPSRNRPAPPLACGRRASEGRGASGQGEGERQERDPADEQSAAPNARAGPDRPETVRRPPGPRSRSSCRLPQSQ